MKLEEVCMISMFVVIISSVVISDVTFKVSKWNVCPPTDSLFLALFSVFVHQCVVECTLRKHCHVVGYVSSINYCELHTTSNSSDMSGGTCFLIYRKDMQGYKECDCGDWKTCSPQEPSICEPRECELLGPLENGHYLGNVNRIKAKKRIRCDPGYRERNGVKAIECLETGKWSHNISCVIVDCGKLPSIDHGHLELSSPIQTLMGGTARVSCDVGYLASQESITCTESAEWQTTSCIPRECETGWKRFAGSCYLFEFSPFGWEDAKNFCYSLGARLVIVDSENEHNYIREKCRELAIDYVWIGARFDPNFREHRWIDGSEISVDGWWCPGMPGQSHGCIDYLSLCDYLWNSHWDCVNTPGPFLCEKES